jgi:hypothetical protein
MSRSRALVTALILACGLPLASPARAEFFRCAQPDSAQSVAFTTLMFLPYRFEDLEPLPFSSLRYRDLEMHWDALADSALSDSATKTMKNLAHTLVGIRGNNVMGYNMNRIELVYDYFHRPLYPRNYNPDSTRDTTAMVFGDSSLSGLQDIQPYKPTDRCHVDLYLCDSSRVLTQVTGADAQGMYPSPYVTVDEDVSDGRSDPADVRHFNTLAVKLPVWEHRFDYDGTGWTRSDGRRSGGFFHEFEHGLTVGRRGGTLLDEQFAAAAEAVVGVSDTTSHTDFAYTWSLLAADATVSIPTCESLRGHGFNYVGRSAFAAYLAYNFLGADSSATLAGMQDDLLRKWVMRAAATPTPGMLAQLRDVLPDSTCADCSSLLDPPGQTMTDTMRLAMLHHDWRIANFVNNPALGHGQYGYPTRFGFSPTRHLKAFQSVDGCQADDAVALPQEVTIGFDELRRPLELHGQRWQNGNSYPLALQPYGSEYWVIHSDPGLAASAQDLIVRVWSDSLGRLAPPYGAANYAGRLMASAVSYSDQNDALWRHSDWATAITPAQWTDTDSLGSVLELVILNFGTATKAVLLPLTLADAGSAFTDSGLDYLEKSRDGARPEFQRGELIPYRIQLQLRPSASAGANPVTVSSMSGPLDLDSPCFSPDGNQVAYARTEANGHWTIYVSSADGSGAGVPLGLGGTLGFDEQQPDWSPRGDLLAFRTKWYESSCPGIGLFSPTGGETGLTFGLQGADSWPSFSPNGQSVAYVRRLISARTGLADSSWQLRRIGIDRTEDQFLAQADSATEIRSPRWSPDGKWIYYLRDTALTVVSATHEVPNWPRSVLAPSALSFDLARGSGKLLVEESTAATYDSVGMDLAAGQYAVMRKLQPYHRVNLRDTTAWLNTPCLYHTGAVYRSPRWSFDGTRVALVTNENGGSRKDLYVFRPSFNLPPVFTSAPSDVAYPSTCCASIEYAATDPEGETVVWEAEMLPPGASLSPQGQLTWSCPRAGEYYSVIRARDGSGGVAQKVIRLSVAPDAVRPAPVANLRVRNGGRHTLAIQWSDTGDDSLSGTACQSRLAYSTNPITETTFWSCDTVAAAVPDAPGTPQCGLVHDLTSCTPYYFGLKTRDDAGQWSALRTTAGRTVCAGSLETSCLDALDETRPAPVAGLVVGATAGRHSLLVRWSEAGDDSSSGIAARTRLVYSTSAVTEANFWSISDTLVTPAPEAPGTPECVAAVNLAQCSTYYFGLKTADDVGQWSALATTSGQTQCSGWAETTCIEGLDVTPPAPAADLEVGQTGRHSLLVQWSEVGDDGLSGLATRTRLAYSTSAVTEASFWSITDTLVTPVPEAPGTPECVLAENLTQCTTYYFGLETADEMGNWSELATTSGQTRCSGWAEALCEEGDLLVQSGSGSAGWLLEGSLLEDAGTDSVTVERLRLPRAAADSDSVRVRLVTRGGGWSLDAVALAAVDHDSSETACLDGDRVVVGTIGRAARVRDGSADLAVELAHGEAVSAAAGSEWVVDLGAGDPGIWLAIKAEGEDTSSAAPGSGITVQRRGALAQWVTVGAVSPQGDLAPPMADSIPGGEARLLFHRDYRVQRLGRFDSVRSAGVQQLRLGSTLHSQAGSVTEALGAGGNGEVVLGPQESVVLAFETPAPDSGRTRDYFLTILGRRVAGSTLTRAQAANVQIEQEPTPLAFALHQCQPNPFSHTTVIAFDLPRPTSVRLEVFDLQGRRVIRLADGFHPAGRFSLAWDGRSESGSAVRPGVYVYRLRGGEFRAERKMTLLP